MGNGIFKSFRCVVMKEWRCVSGFDKRDGVEMAIAKPACAGIQFSAKAAVTWPWLAGQIGDTRNREYRGT